MQRQCEKEIIYIFDLHYKELAKDIIQDKDSIPKHKEEQKLDNKLDEKLNYVKLIEIDNNKNNSIKYSLEEVDKILINTFAIAIFSLLL